jgi:hypothetical protein
MKEAKEFLVNEHSDELGFDPQSVDIFLRHWDMTPFILEALQESVPALPAAHQETITKKNKKKKKKKKKNKNNENIETKQDLSLSVELL